MISLGSRVLLSAMAVAVVALAPSIYAVTQFREVERIFALSSAAGEVRRSLENVEDSAHEYAHFIEAGGEPQADRGAQLLGTALLALSRSRQLVVQEVGLMGPIGSVEEGEEIVLLDRIGNELRAATRDRSEAWTPLVQTAINHELAELRENEARIARVMTRIELVFAIEALLAVLVTAFSYLFLRRSIVTPLERLVVGSGDFAGGNFATRIEPGGVKELRQTIRQFNRMADDVTSREVAMTSANEDLELKVARRTEDLIEAHDHMRELATKKTEFLADISHELRTPVAIMRGEADVTLRNPNAGQTEMHDALVRIQRQAVALTGLVDDLLFVARNDVGSPAMKLSNFDLATLLRDSADDVRTLIEADNGTISVDGLETEAMVQASPSRLGQVMRILIDNAIRYCARVPVIQISLHQAPGGYRVDVRDNGIGISRADAERVFERFQRGANVRDDGSGSGLGLPLASAIVAAHGGTLVCDSTPGQGTTMSFILPSTGARKAVA